MTTYPPDVPLPRPYLHHDGRVTPAAQYRALVERLTALGLWDASVPTGMRFYVAVQRACQVAEQHKREETHGAP